MRKTYLYLWYHERLAEVETTPPVGDVANDVRAKPVHSLTLTAFIGRHDIWWAAKVQIDSQPGGRKFGLACVSKL